MERRDFLTNIGQASAIFAAGTFLASCSKSSATPTATTPPPGGGALATIDLKTELTSIDSTKVVGNIIIIRTAADNVPASFEALSLICTHQGCTVNYDSSNKDFLCPCHGSAYDINGAVTNGPAIKALTKYTITITGTSLTVS
jgi:cytochrome b6-f complex iron-sulfur subunit